MAERAPVGASLPVPRRWRTRLASVEAAAIAGIICAVGWSVGLGVLLASPVAGASDAEITQPNHVETVVAQVDVDGAPHLVKFSRYHDNQQFWTVPGERDERLRRRKTITVTEPEPDEFELYDLTVDPFEERNLAHPSYADEHSRALQQTMLGLLHEQLAAKRLTPSAGERPGYRAPAPV